MGGRALRVLGDVTTSMGEAEVAEGWVVGVVILVLYYQAVVPVDLADLPVAEVALLAIPEYQRGIDPIVCSPPASSRGSLPPRF